MFNQEDAIQSIEISIEEAQQMIAKADALARLHDNKDFQMVIEKGFFEQEASRSVLLRGDPNMQKPEDQEQIDKVITSIGGLYQYFNTIFRKGNMAKRSLVEDQETREEILREQLEGESLQ